MGRWTVAEQTQRERIREAVAEASKMRDRLDDARAEELMHALQKASDDVAAAIDAFDAKTDGKPWESMRETHLKALQDSIDEVTAELSETMGLKSLSHIEDALKLGIEDGVLQGVALGLPDFTDLSPSSRGKLISKVFSTIDRSAVNFLANYETQLLGQVAENLGGKIKATVLNGVLTGKPVREVAKEIGKAIPTGDKAAFKAAGKTVFKSAQQRAMLVARTETVRAHSEGRKTQYREMGVKKVEWLTADDERTCPECEPLHLRVFKVDDAPGPPKHPACRCAIAAFVPEEED